MLASQSGGAIRVQVGAGATRLVGCAFELNVADYAGAVYAYERSGPMTSPTACSGATARLPCAPHVSFPWRVTDALMRMRARAQGDGGAAEVQGNTGRVAISGCAFDANAASRVRSSFRFVATS